MSSYDLVPTLQNGEYIGLTDTMKPGYLTVGVPAREAKQQFQAIVYLDRMSLVGGKVPNLVKATEQGTLTSGSLIDTGTPDFISYFQNPHIVYTPSKLFQPTITEQIRDPERLGRSTFSAIYESGFMAICQGSGTLVSHSRLKLFVKDSKLQITGLGLDLPSIGDLPVTPITAALSTDAFDTSKVSVLGYAFTNTSLSLIVNGSVRAFMLINKQASGAVAAWPAAIIHDSKSQSGMLNIGPWTGNIYVYGYSNTGTTWIWPDSGSWALHTAIDLGQHQSFGKIEVVGELHDAGSVILAPILAITSPVSYPGYTDPDDYGTLAQYTIPVETYQALNNYQHATRYQGGRYLRMQMAVRNRPPDSTSDTFKTPLVSKIRLGLL